MKISNTSKVILTTLMSVGGIFAYAQNQDSVPAPEATSPQSLVPQQSASENSSTQATSGEISSSARDRIEYFRQRREARRAARAGFQNGGRNFERPRFSRIQPQEFRRPTSVAIFSQSATKEISQTGEEEVKFIGGNNLLHDLATKNPFVPVGGKSAEQNVDGISLRSVVMVDGKWVFSVSDKAGKTMWLGIGEEIENAPCKIDSFDENAMTARANVGGRQIDLALSERSVSASSGKVELVDAIKPRRMIAPHERAKVWSQYATNEQREAANRVWQTARAQGRNYLNREDRRKIFEIERQIQIPENQNQGGGQPPMPPR